MRTQSNNTCPKHLSVAAAALAKPADQVDRSYLGFHTFIDAESGETFGSFLIFEHAPNKEWTGSGEEPFEHGFYWQSCFPGCLPDADSCGPFATARAAYNDAQNG